MGSAVDGSGDIFIADATLGYIVEAPAGCSSASCEEIAGGGFIDLTGVAVDGNGTLYALSGGSNGTVTSLTWNAVSNSYVAQNALATDLALPASSPSGIAADDLGDIYVTDTQNHRVLEYPWNPATNSYGAPLMITIGSASSLPGGVAIDGNGNIFIADPGTMTVEEITPAGLAAGAAPTILASGVNARSVTVDSSGDVYYSDSVANTVTKIPWNGNSFGPTVVLANSLSMPFGISVDDGGNILVADNGTRSIVKVTVDTPPGLRFANTKVGATSSDSPMVATLANIGTTALDFPPTSAANPALASGYALNHAATCPQVFSTSAAQTLSEGPSCTYAIDFSPAESNISQGPDTGSLTVTDDNLNLSGATQVIALTATAIADDSSSVTITLNPASPVVFGRAISVGAAAQDNTVPAADTSNYTSGGSVTAAYSVTDATAAVTLSNLSQAYNGQPHSVTVATMPAGLNVSITYNGSAAPPTAGGSYAVVAAIQPDYSGMATGTLTIARGPVDSVTLVSAPNPVLTTTPVTLTATVTSSLGVPTGIVNFMDNDNGFVFATAPLVNGVATFTTSTEPFGVYNIVAAYLGDASLLPLTSPVFVSTILDFSVGIASSSASTGTAITTPGSTALYQFNLDPLVPDGSDRFLSPVTLTISGQPSGSTYTITPSTIPAGSGPTPVMLAITPPQDMSMLHHDGCRLAPVLLALLLLPFSRRMRRTGKGLARFLSLAIFLAMGIGIIGGLSSWGAVAF